ncbi:hypothetical protein BKA93DRAFT_750750 [Sparassis latifolia]
MSDNVPKFKHRDLGTFSRVTEPVDDLDIDVDDEPTITRSMLIQNLTAQLPVDIEFVRVLLVRSDMPTLLGWAKTTSGARQEVNRELDRTLTALLSHFMPAADVQLFKVVMQLTESVISGSAALWFLECSASWPPKDLDLYVAHN